MKYIIVNPSLVLLVFFGCFSVSLAGSSGNINSRNLKDQFNVVRDEINKINEQSEEVVKISNEYKEIASSHLKVVTSYEMSKSSCLNKQAKYEKKKEVDTRMVRFQNRKVVECFERIGKMTHSFDDINRKFVALSKDVTMLEGLSSVMKDSLTGLKNELDTITKMIEIEKMDIQTLTRKAQETMDRMDGGS